MENKFIVYYEYKETPEAKHLNGHSVACENLASLILTLKEAQKISAQNINIFTIPNAAYML